jgi:hypothetical protein
MRKLRRYPWLAARLIFASWYFGVGVLGFILNDQAKDVAKASTGLERAMAESGFLNPLLSLCCSLGGSALFLRRTSPLGLVILTPLVITIFCFHLIITENYGWGALNLALLLALLWHFRDGLEPLWSYTESEG